MKNENVPAGNFHARVIAVLQKVSMVEREYISSLSEGERNAVGTYQDWAPKDRLAHITYWHRRVVENLSYLSRNQSLPEYPELEECNRQNFEENRDKPAQAIIREAEAVMRAIPLALQPFSEEDLRSPGKFPGDGQTTLLSYLLGGFYIHSVFHLCEGYLKLGMVDEVDRLADQMVADILSLDDSPRMRGTILYDRACFYAVSGKLDQALQTLEQSLNLRPDLKEWASQDSDLNNLHADPAFLALVGS
jgi:tetratricopeptide (TPR) repeat protein